MVEIVRVKQSGLSTLSQLYFDGIFECWLLEDAVREVKIHSQTCIPTGEYKLILNTVGGMNVKYKKDYSFHKGMIEIDLIPNFDNVYIHKGNRIKDTMGCPITGDFYGFEGKDFIVMNSAKAYEREYPLLVDRIIKGDDRLIVRNLKTIIPLDLRK